ncbi:response regulator [Mesorhizobium atlanticum]
MQLWLPRSLKQPARPIEQGQVSRASIDGNGGRPSILLVDDSDALRELTAASLRQSELRRDMRRRQVPRRWPGIEKAPGDFDVIVTDYAMPLVSGLDVIRFARNLKADWPAVIITGYADTKAIGDLPSDVPLLAKPYKDQQLVESILLAEKTRGRA